MDKALDDKHYLIDFAHAEEIQITNYPEKWNIFVVDQEGNTQHLQRVFRNKHDAVKYLYAQFFPQNQLPINASSM